METAAEESSERSYVGRIPVRNLWLLMFYASDLFRTRGTATVGWEDSPDEIPQLVARILSEAVEKRQRRQLSRGYRMREAALSRVRGRIDILQTERHQLYSRGLVACRFDDLTVDTSRNRFVRAALETISGLLKRHPELAHRCSSLARDMMAQGVSGVVPTRAQMSVERFGRNDADDRMMIGAARLALELALPTEGAGKLALPLPDREGTWVRNLFEKAVGGFYTTVLQREEWSVRQGRVFGWPVSASTPRIAEILPRMVTDVILEHRQTGRRIVIDTKFTTIVTKGWHREETLRSGYIYQIYAYLRSQACQEDVSSITASGVLLHPAVDESVDETVVIQGHAIRFITVDLTASTQHIRRQLLHICETGDLTDIPQLQSPQRL